MAKTTKSKTPETKKSLIAPNDSVKITLTWSSVEPVFKKTLGKFARNAKIEGFRVGKAPIAMVEQQVGFAKVADEVLRQLVPDAYEAIIKKEQKKPITTPEFNPIKLDKGQDWVLEAFFSPIPEVKLGDYKKAIDIAKGSALKFIDERNKEIKKEAETCKSDDKNHDHAHAHQELDETAKKEIRLQHIFEELVDNFAPAIGELLLRQETQAEYERLAKQLEQYKISTDDYLKRRQITIEQLSQELASSVLSRLQLDFIMAEISKDQKLSVSDEEVQAELEQAITDERMRQEIDDKHPYRSQLKANLLQKKTLEFLLSL